MKRFFDPMGKKIEKFGIFRGNLTKPKSKPKTQPDPGQKILTQTHHLLKALSIFFTNYLFVIIF